MNAQQLHRIFLTLTMSISAFCLLGCQQKSESKPTSGTNQPAPAKNVGTPSSKQLATTEQGRRQNERWTDANGVEYLGNVPLDVFYDRPLKIVLDNAAVTSAALPSDRPSTISPPGETEMAASKNEPPNDATQSNSSQSSDGATNWEELIPVEVVLNEVNQIRNSMTQALQNVGSYKRSMLMIPPQAASMAVLAGIAIEHPNEITWRDDAKYIRDLARQMNESTLAPTKKDQTRLQILFENIVNTLNRSRPADLDEPDPELSFPDVAEMGHLMVRMEQAEKKLKTEAGTETAFTSKQDMIRHEAAILGTMTHVTTKEGYGYADDEEFLGYAQQVVNAARRIRDSVDTGDFNAYELALTKVSTGCQTCHSVYRN